MCYGARSEVSLEAVRSGAQYGLHTPDAIHAATAIDFQATGILTNNERFKALTKEALWICLFDGTG